MAKLKPDPVTQSDLVDFLDNESDFGFELRVLQQVRSLGLQCEHSGTYDDPATKRPREFDIRAISTIEDQRLRLAVECKNIRPNYPLVVSCAPRTSEESFQDVIVAHERSGEIAFPEYARVVRFTKNETMYPVGRAIGKSCNQVGRALDGSVVASDSSIYDKWSQAVGSAKDLIARAHYDADDTDRELYVSLVVPVVVVPNGMLWATDYDAGGVRLNNPVKVARVSYYIDNTHTVGGKLSRISYAMSHLEIVTENGLQEFINAEWFDDGRRNAVLSVQRALEIIAES